MLVQSTALTEQYVISIMFLVVKVAMKEIKADLAKELTVNATSNVRKHFGAISVTNIVERAALATLVTELQAIV